MNKPKERMSLDKRIFLSMGIAATALGLTGIISVSTRYLGREYYRKGLKQTYENISPQYSAPSTPTGQLSSNIWGIYDFNADGKDEMISIQPSGEIVVFTQSKPNNYGPTAVIGSVAKYIPSAPNLTLALDDTNKDGLNDLLIVDKKNILQIYENNFRQGKIHPIQAIFPKSE
jgi:hypothetical protein